MAVAADHFVKQNFDFLICYKAAQTALEDVVIHVIKKLFNISSPDIAVWVLVDKTGDPLQ